MSININSFEIRWTYSSTKNESTFKEINNRKERLFKPRKPYTKKVKQGQIAEEFDERNICIPANMLLIMIKKILTTKSQTLLTIFMQLKGNNNKIENLKNKQVKNKQHVESILTKHTKEITLPLSP